MPYAPNTLQSGLGFTGVANNQTFNIGDIFEVGQLVHFNREIKNNGAPSDATLRVVMNFSDPAGLTGTFNTVFTVNETLGTGTDDIITFPTAFPSETTIIGGVTYTMTLLGFGADSSHLVLDIVTPENGLPNSTLLWGQVTTANSTPDCSGAYPSVGSLWPPNHKMVPIEILGVTDPDGDPVTITITGITSDEATASDSGSGGAEHAPDASGVGTATANLRAERSGTGNGRVYEVSFEASDGKGGFCNNAIQICVPHDQGTGDACVDDGQNYDATAIN